MRLPGNASAIAWDAGAIRALPNFTAGCLRLLETDWAEGDKFRAAIVDFRRG
jgi:hypothetical protein